jgi:hypothetical protein
VCIFPSPFFSFLFAFRTSSLFSILRFPLLFFIPRVLPSGALLSSRNFFVTEEHLHLLSLSMTFYYFSHAAYAHRGSSHRAWLTIAQVIVSIEDQILVRLGYYIFFS